MSEAAERAAMDRARAAWWTPILPARLRTQNAAFNAGWTACWLYLHMRGDVALAKPAPQEGEEKS